MKKEEVLEQMKLAVSRFHHDEQGCYHSRNLDGLSVRLKMNPEIAKKTRSQIISCLQKINDDLWNISALVERLDVMRVLARDNEYMKCHWSTFAKLDINHFHTDYRSIFDYSAEIVAACAGRSSGQIPKSFRK